MNSSLSRLPAAATPVAQAPNYGRCLANADAYKNRITPLLQQQATLIEANGGTGLLNELRSILPGAGGRGAAIRGALDTIKGLCDSYGERVQSCELTYKGRPTPEYAIPYPPQCGSVETDSTRNLPHR